MVICFLVSLVRTRVRVVVSYPKKFIGPFSGLMRQTEFQCNEMH